MARYKVSGGMARVALYWECGRREVVLFAEPVENMLMELKGEGWEVESVDSCGAQAYHIVVVLDDVIGLDLALSVATTAIIGLLEECTFFDGSECRLNGKGLARKREVDATQLP